MYFTQDDFKKIHEWLKRNSVKDSEFPIASPENGTEHIVLVQNGKNVKISLNDFKDMVGGVISAIAPPTITSENNTITITAPMHNKIYYTLGEDHYPELNENGSPVDSTNTLVYTSPISYDKDTIVRAVAIYTNSEGKLLISEISEYTAIYEVTLQAPEINFSNDENNIVEIINRNGKESEVYYTLDGTEPTNSSTLYKVPFSIEENCTIKAVVILDNEKSSTTTKEVTFTKRTITVPSSVSRTYSGGSQTVYSNTEDYTVSGDLTGTNVGKYSVTLTLRNTAKTKWSTTDENSVIVEWYITKKTLTVNLEILPAKSEYEVGDTITFIPSVDDDNSTSGKLTIYKNSTSGIIISDGKYTLRDEDTNGLKIIVKYTLDSRYDNNYQTVDAQKEIIVVEKSIPWQYACISEDDAFTAAGKYEALYGEEEAWNHITINDVYKEGIFSIYEEISSEEPFVKLTVSSETPYLILAYPKNNTSALYAQSTLGADLGSDYLYGHNSIDAVNIKIYQIGSGPIRIKKK